MNNKHNYIAFIVTLSGAMFLTMGHYFEIWQLIYPVCLMVGVATSMVLED